MHEMRKKYQDLRDNHDPKNHLNNDTPMCELHEANYIQSEDYQNQDSRNSFFCQSHYDPNDSKKSLTELNNDVRNDLEDFKRHIRSIVSNMFVKNNVNDMILKMKQNEKNYQTNIKNMERKIDEWEKSQNVTLEQIDRTDPPPLQPHTEHVNAVFTGSEKSDYSPKTQKDPPPPIIVNNKIGKDKPIKTSKTDYQVVKTNEYPFCGAWSLELATRDTEGFKGLLHALNATMVPTKHSLLVLRSSKYPKSKKNVLDEEEVLCQP
ncbi:hypothetical protein Tco_1269447 [Tanacetum coccineum]